MFALKKEVVESGIGFCADSGEYLPHTWPTLLQAALRSEALLVLGQESP